MQRIVIVDDTALNRRVLESLVTQLGDVQALSFAVSAEVLERFPTLDASLFIVDYRMPAPDGMAVLSAIRADERTRHTPVVMVTAAEEREVCYAALELGASDFLVRPIDPREFTRRMGNLLVLDAARREATERLQYEEQAARIYARRLDIIWRAGSAAVGDDTFLRNLIDEASRALINRRHFCAAIARLDGDEFAIEIANDAPDGAGRVVAGQRFPIDNYREAIEANVIEAVMDLPLERRGTGAGALRFSRRSRWGRRGTSSAFTRASRCRYRFRRTTRRSWTRSRACARAGSNNACSSSDCGIRWSTIR